MAHILNGHIDYYARQTGLPFLPELNWKGTGREPQLVRQAIEMDADTTAAQVLINNQFEKSTNLKSRNLPPWDKYYATFQSALRNWLFANATLFRLFGDSPFAGSDLSTSSYPPMRVRQLNFATQAVRYVELGWTGIEVRDAWLIAATAFTHAEDAFSLVLGTPVAAEGLLEAWNGSADKHIKDNLQACWDEHLKGELAPFAYRER